MVMPKQALSVRAAEAVGKWLALEGRSRRPSATPTVLEVFAESGLSIVEGELEVLGSLKKDGDELDLILSIGGMRALMESPDVVTQRVFRIRKKRL